MREILFRGKRVSDGKWVYGSYIKATFHWHNYGIHDDWIAISAGANGGWFALGCKYPVIPETVDQFTGLTDMDGKRIFEGDIVHVTTQLDEEGDGEVAFRDGSWLIDFDGDDSDSLFNQMEIGHVVEIIGNIYDNAPLKGGEENA